MTMRCQVLPYQRADGPANMALDEALLDASAADPTSAWFRSYGWTEPTLSLGYFQRVAEMESDPRWGGVPFVRRATGGGAIWHDQEITYALALPRSHPRARQGVALYQAVHEAIAALLREQGLGADRRGPVGPEIEGGRPFLCFTDRDPADIVSQGSKVVGSAQRRRSGALLQHGALLLWRSTRTPELPGVGDLGARATDEHFWSSQLEERIPRALGLVLERRTLPPDLREHAQVLEANVYRDDAWNRRR